MDNKRIKLHLKQPNPLFEKWLEELYVNAEGTQGRSTYEEALMSLRRYPLVLKSGGECAILKGFGKKICTYLDSKLTEHNIIHDIPSPPRKVAKKSRSPKKSHRKLSKTQRYKPPTKSLAYSILVALYRTLKKINFKSHLNESELTRESEHYFNQSICGNDFNSELTSLINIQYVKVLDIVGEKQYSLTEDGRNIAFELLQDVVEDLTDETHVQNVIHNIKKHEHVVINLSQDSDDELPNIVINKSDDNLRNESDDGLPVINCNKVFGAKESDDELPNVNWHPITNDDGEFPKVSLLEQEDETESCIFFSGCFDVLLLVDKKETTGKGKKDEAAIKELERHKMIKYELRDLKVGDFLWVARNKLTKDELVLPYIVERKRIDDLGKSIKDGRFHEQKFRLKQSGIKNVIYLLEFCEDIKHTGLPVSTLKQAIANTRIQDGFDVHYTDSLPNSIKFLAMMTKNLEDQYNNKSLIKGKARGTHISLVSFQEFNAMSVKTKTATVSDMLIKHLLQLKGVSVEKALAISSLYTTPLNLMKTYDGIDRASCEKLLCKINHNNKVHSIGINVSKSIHRYFTSDMLC